MKNEDRFQWFRVKSKFLKQCTDTHCHYCNVFITDKNRSVDHMTPISKGGALFDLANLALCCKRCNSLKTDYDYEYFVKNRDLILTNFYKKIKEQKERIAVQEKFEAINQSKDLSQCFISEKTYDPEEKKTIHLFRSLKVSLVQITPNRIEFNFAETFPKEKEDFLKDEIRNLLDKYGTPVKAIKAYVDFSVSNVLFEINPAFKVLVDLETMTETLLSKKESSKFLK